MDAIVCDAGVNLASVTRTGETWGTLPAGKHLKIETSPDGEELLDYEVPAGKTAQVRVSVSIVETNA